MSKRPQEVKKKQRHSSLIDDKQYWKNRHASQSNLKASGLKSVSVRSNKYIYMILTDQYLKLLNSLDINQVRSVLDCGFGDGHFLKFYKTHFPDLKLYGVDISRDAKNKVDFMAKKNLYVSDLTDFSPKRKFDIVHSFDVIYHILENDDYVKALTNIASLSNRYVILHQQFLNTSPLISSKHVNLRRAEYTTQLLNSQGFYLMREIPTHFLATRLLTYKLNKFMPHTLYKIDRYIAQNIHPSAQEFLASHHIRVYSKYQAA